MPLKSNSDGQIVNVRARFAWDGKIVIADSPALDRWVSDRHFTEIPEIPKLVIVCRGFRLTQLRSEVAVLYREPRALITSNHSVHPFLIPIVVNKRIGW